MNGTEALMWYDNSILMSFLGVIVGAIIGFVGSIVQSHINAKNNIDVVKAQSKKDIEQHRYLEKEKLYSEIINFNSQLLQSIDVTNNNGELTCEQETQFNSLKARLAIFSNLEIRVAFYDMVIYITKETNMKKIIFHMNTFTNKLLEDLK